jgi:hypothetical protein
MKKFLAYVVISFLFISIANAETCPNLIKQIDEMLAESKQLSAEQIKEVKSLRAQGEEAYKEGNKEECQKLLSQALDLLG